MPPFEDMQRYLNGAWRLMMGKADGMRMLDLSADGFWNSFFAMAVALPAMVVGWVGIANEIGGALDGGGATRLAILVRLAIVDAGTWVLPLVVLALAAPRAGIADRFVHYVVATNWASAIVVWMMLPPALLRLLAPSLLGFAALLSLGLFLLSMMLTWRVTNLAIGKGASIGSAVFAAMFVLSLAVLFGLQSLLGVSAPEALPG